MQRPTFLSVVDNNEHAERDPLENHPLFTPDLEYFTPPTTIALNNTNAYCPRTLTSYNMKRHTILPVYRPSPASEPTTATSSGVDDMQPPLLLCNVSEQHLSQVQLARRAPNAYTASFDLVEKNRDVIDHSRDSFMISMHQQLLVDLSKKWHISIPLLDYNLARLRRCAKLCLEQLQQRARQEQLQLLARLPVTATFSVEELPLALEFYLQMDVDLFYLKTCWFRDAKPAEESIFCSKSPLVQYSMTACNKTDCPCCHPSRPRRYHGQVPAVRFNLKEMHQFVNGYRAILNCPTTCETSNIIYVLTCPCGQYDYVDVTAASFRDCLTMHRYESNRVLAEFIFGPAITNHFSQGITSERTRRNNAMWLYQHAARCPQAIQLFVDANPDYGCFIPMSIDDPALKRDNATYSPSDEKQLNSGPYVRTAPYAKHIVRLVPTPPESYVFSDRQKFEQRRFFQTGKDRLLSSRLETNVDLYDAAIIAVLPENCSEMLRQLVLSLFITHADCQLNKTGRLTNEPVYRQYPVRDHWCVNFLRRPVSRPFSSIMCAMLHKYHFYKNDSHLYVVPKPFHDNATELDVLRRYLAERWINWYKVEPTLVNCTVAPQAAGCAPIKTASMAGQDGPSFYSNSSALATAVDRLLASMLQQHQQILRFYLLFAIILSLILLISILSCLHRRQKRTRLRSTSDDACVTHAPAIQHAHRIIRQGDTNPTKPLSVSSISNEEEKLIGAAHYECVPLRDVNPFRTVVQGLYHLFIQ